MRSKRRPGRTILLIAGVMLAGILPSVAGSAAAQPVDPVTMFIPTTGPNMDQLMVGSLDGSGTPTLLSPGAYIDWYDVSQDGGIVAAAVSTRPFASSGWDTSWGVVRVSRADGTTRVIGTNYDSPVSVTPDGHKICWISDDWVVCSTDGQPAVREGVGYINLAPRSGEQVIAFAVSPDGTYGAALYQTSSSRFLRVTDIHAVSYLGCTGTWPLSGGAFGSMADFTWLDDTHFLYALASASGVTDTEVCAVGGGTTSSGLGAVRGLRQVGSSWYMFKDGTGGSLSTGSTTDPTIAPTTWTPWTGSTDMAAYKITGSTPASFTTADNRAVTTALLAMRQSVVVWRHRATYCALADYLVPEGGTVDYAYANLRGTLYYSIDAGRHWAVLTTTTGEHAVSVDAPCDLTSGSTQLLRRNTWFRWVFAGDMITTPSTSRTALVRVVPVVTVKVATYGSKRLVSGTATRTAGTAVLQRYYRHRWVKVAAVKITSKGAFSFGKRQLPRGAYRVVTVKDAWWNGGVKAFRI